MKRSKHNISFLPEDFQDYILEKIRQENINFRLASPRKSKYGDYRYNFLTKIHAISVNIDLSEVQFMITFIHELAHKVCYDKFQGKVQSHGAEWKAIFVDLLKEAKTKLVLSEENTVKFDQAIKSPKASGDDFEVIDKHQLLVSDLSPETQFELKSGRTFRLIKKRRTRFLCADLNNGKLYAVSGKAQVERIL